MPNPGMPVQFAPGHGGWPAIRRKGTYVSRKHRGRRKGAMKKTTKKGAYKPARKKQMAIRRAPLVEGFKYQSAPDTNESFRLSRTVAYNNVMNRAFIAGYVQNLDVPNDGLSTDGTITPFVGPTCRGRDIYSKMTALKMRFEFPENIHAIRTAYQPPIVYWGWIKKTAFRTNAMTPAPAALTEDFYKTLIDDELLAQYNEANDRLDFTDRRPTQYKIIGKRTIFPDRNKSISNTTWLKGAASVALPTSAESVLPLPGGGAENPAESMAAITSLPPVFHTCRWKVNRKIGLQRTTSWMGPSTAERFVPADCWIPFCFVFNPSFASQINSASVTDPNESDHGQIQVSFNSVHYYTDS
jgi:hypothetical protein